MPDHFSLEGRVAFVTGAARGLGYAMARGLAEHGARVVLNDLDAEALARTVQGLADHGFAAEGMAFDVAVFDSCRAAIADTVAEHGRLDVMVNNAGISVGAPITEFPMAEWQRHLDIHLTAPFVFCQEAGRHMAGRGAGSIINIASIAGPDIIVPTTPAYNAAKAGVVGLTKSFAVELGPFGVRCNAIKPGYFHTSLGGGLKEGEPPGPDERGFVADLETHTPLARMADPREIAGLAVYLASDASSFVNGALIPIDGGLTSMQMPMPHLDRRNREVVAKGVVSE